MSFRRLALGPGLVLTLSLSAALAACGGGGDARQEKAAGPSSPGVAAGSLTNGDAGETAVAENEVDIIAQDVAFAPEEVTVPTGTIKINLTNEGMIVHTLVFDDVLGFVKLETATKGASDSGTVDLQPGTYTFYCDQPGHRAAGMVGTITVV